MRGARPRQRSKGLSSIPSVVNLPGGIQLRGVPFKIVAHHPDGSPKTFELLPRGADAERDCVLYADEEWIRGPNPLKVAEVEP